jgi:hypothetical protein
MERMPKTKKKLPKTTQALVEEKLVCNKEYKEWLKEHDAKLRRLEREMSGRNMVEPND